MYVHRRRWKKKEISIQFLIIFFSRFSLKSQFFVWIFIYFKIIFIFIFSEFLSKYFFSKFKINKLEILKKNFPKKTQLNRFDTLYNSFKISFQNLFFCRGKRVILFDDYDKDCACSVCCVCVCVFGVIFFFLKNQNQNKKKTNSTVFYFLNNVRILWCFSIDRLPTGCSCLSFSLFLLKKSNQPNKQTTKKTIISMGV